MNPTRPASARLGAVLLFDAATCLAMGVALLALADLLASFLGLPVALLRWAGALLLPCAALMAIAGRRVPPPRALVMLIVAGNLAWVAASAYVAAALPGIAAAGQVVVIVQALAVLVLAVLEWRGAAAPAGRHGLRAA